MKLVQAWRRFELRHVRILLVVALLMAAGNAASGSVIGFAAFAILALSYTWDIRREALRKESHA